VPDVQEHLCTLEVKGYTPPALNRILGLPAGTVEGWKAGGKMLPDEEVLLTILGKYPWMLEGAEEGFTIRSTFKVNLQVMLFSLIEAAVEAITEDVVTGDPKEVQERVHRLLRAVVSDIAVTLV